jgi:hypothetical protein
LKLLAYFAHYGSKHKKDIIDNISWDNLASAVVATFLGGNKDSSERFAETNSIELFLPTGTLRPNLKFHPFSVKSKLSAEPEPKNHNQTTANIYTGRNDSELPDDGIYGQGNISTNSVSYDQDIVSTKSG